MKYLSLFIFVLSLSCNTCFALEIKCRYVTDYKENLELMAENDPPMPDARGNVGILDSIIHFGTGIYASIDNDIFYCTYDNENSNNFRIDALEFLEKLRDKKIIPLFFYDGWTSKFYEEFDFDDINTPFSQKREKGAQQWEFVFRKKSVKSTIRFFWLLFQGK